VLSMPSWKRSMRGLGIGRLKGGVVTRGGMCVYRGGMGDGVSDLGYLSYEGCVVAVLCA
jgi:hypothetical protein